MRRLAPMFVMTSIVALVGTNALAMGDHHKAKNSSTASNTSSMPASGSSGNTGTGTSAGSVGSTGGTGTTLGYTAGDRNTQSSTMAMNDAESKPTASASDTTTQPKAKKSRKRHVASNADKTSGTGNVETSNGQAAGSSTGKSGGAGGDSSSGSAGPSSAGSSK